MLLFRYVFIDASGLLASPTIRPVLIGRTGSEQPGRSPGRSPATPDLKCVRRVTVRATRAGRRSHARSSIAPVTLSRAVAGAVL